MKQTTFLPVIFFFLLGMNLLGNFYSITIAAHVSKVLLMPALAVIFLRSSYSFKSSKLARWILFAILFSWGGDVLLIFQEDYPAFFLLGLASFLLAHICYIFAYSLAKNATSLSLSWSYWAILISILVIYLVVLFSKIGLGLGSFLIPVIIYALTISCMLLAAFSRTGRTTRISFIYVVYGSSLFVFSDSLIALNKFSMPITHAGLWIMLTYGIAQYLIIKGILEHRQ